MKDLKIGDVINVDKGQFERIQSFGHYNAAGSASYVQNHSKATKMPLGVSAQHMVFNGDSFAPAGTVKEGDFIQLGNGAMAKVDKMTTGISRVGMYAPFRRKDCG